MSPGTNGGGGQPEDSETLVLPIARGWDGMPLPATEHAVLRVAFAGAALRIAVEAPFHGDPPPSAPAGPTWALWEHEVVELFVLGPDGSYTEIELGPFGHHLVLRLRGVREVVERELPLELAASVHGARWAAVARLDRRLLPAGPHRVNAYRIWGSGADRRYAAHAPVPGPAPDFHRMECFVSAVIPESAST
mgnify:CR=1 FL=1